jgi:hypothetical protein
MGTYYAGLCAIDGPHGSGKTTLAQEVATVLRVPCVHVDDFVTKNSGGYLDFIRRDELASTLGQRPIIVEGVCLLEVLRRLDIKADTFVYINSPLPGSHTPIGRGAIAEEVRRYHAKFRPAKRADVIHIRTASAGGVRPMNNNEAIDIAIINSQTRLAMTLAFGGMVTMAIGLFVLLAGVGGQDETLVKAAGLEMSARGFGGVILATSAIWAYFAYMARPRYSRSQSTSETFNPKTGQTEYTHHDTRTMAIIKPRSGAKADED